MNAEREKGEGEEGRQEEERRKDHEIVGGDERFLKSG